jgi:adenosylmethionine-8-amino-7-oxononanoate aminotransferase
MAKAKRLETPGGSIWHPFTQMREWESEAPLLIQSGKGATLTDVEGRTYLDATSSLWVNLHGHRHKKIDRALIRQIGQIAHSTLLGLSHPLAARLADRLIQIAPPGLAKVFYSDNGSTAVEIALKMAFDFWRHTGHPEKRKFITFSSAYHGDTIGAVSLGGMDLFHRAYRPLLFETVKVSAPTCYRCPLQLRHPSCRMACIDDVEKTMQQHRHEVAGVVIEPQVQAAAGMLTAPPGYLKRIRELCNHYDLLLIADEVAVGFGRTGRMFACEQEQVTPDLMSLAKGLTGGYLPLAATLTTQKIYEAFLGEYPEWKTFFHGHSYTGNPLGCAAALASLEIFRTERVLEKMQPKIDLFRRRLRPWKRWRHVGDIRQAGLMIGIELVADKKAKTPYPLEQRIGVHVCREARARGVLLRPLGNVIVLMPPLSISTRQIERLLQIVGESIQKITQKIRSGPRRKIAPSPP